ncbi:hypothetical protein DB346_20745 [Verrucomicrobia bacterium LW23]|nr:hypothetical protein DB346_20745 [Verrucomicrobia bacterium LW23]
MFFGFILFGISFCVLGWNEYNSVITANSILEADSSAIEVSADKVEDGNNGKLVVVKGKAVPDEEVKDDVFGISISAIRLKRTVEMYQWVEEKSTKKEKELGGSEKTVTTYSYEKKWDEEYNDSSKFHSKDARDNKANPERLSYSSTTTTVAGASLGEFELSPALRDSMRNFVPFNVGAEQLAAVPADVKHGLKVSEGGFYKGRNPSTPAIGDVRIKFSVVPEGDVTVMAQQENGSFKPWHAGAGKDFEVLYPGLLSKAEVIKNLQSENNMMTWILRAIGFILMLVGLNMIVSPLTVLADVVPFFGGIVGFGTGIICFIIASGLSLLTIAIAWVAVRPMIGIPLLLLGMGAIIGAIVLIVSYANRRPATA